MLPAIEINKLFLTFQTHRLICSIDKRPDLDPVVLNEYRQNMKTAASIST